MIGIKEYNEQPHIIASYINELEREAIIHQSVIDAISNLDVDRFEYFCRKMTDFIKKNTIDDEMTIEKKF